ncbi:DMT family transporter [Rhizobacter sp. OV335]|uniref:DMT family transporter n=1 Tax=Rhizobacter sp. OV335 TaxID=1500264 RepID=UPI0009133AA7|nr:DMT family transporter [Rhizobacter sp. OV335]SHN31455.1 Permease of the drug/metabolite transporter (DMT) superfamily [Rhizobacter sp. OV335]
MSLKYAAPALAAALLFGASTPLAKVLGAELPPILLAGLLYLGSGLGLAAVLVMRRAAGLAEEARGATLAIPRKDIPWLAGAIVAGGVFGPALLMAGLATTDAAPAALLLNVEGVLTAVIAWLVFKENADRQIVLGMAAIVAGGVLLSWQPGAARLSSGALLIIGACLCWAIDNNLTRKVSANDALVMACLKGVLAGTVNTSLGLLAGAHLPPPGPLAATLVVGLAGYGLSLVLFVVALRSLGTSRTGAYFSVAPLFGVLIAFALWPQVPSWSFWGAAALMVAGVWLHLRERHDHLHTHRPMAHVHRHTHDEHHQHHHDFPWDGTSPHVHPHQHAAVTHQHAHFPDIHHRHPH